MLYLYLWFINITLIFSINRIIKVNVICLQLNMVIKNINLNQTAMLKLKSNITNILINFDYSNVTYKFIDGLKHWTIGKNISYFKFNDHI